MSKSEMKKQRQQQKHEEKAAKARAKAAKYQADAKKEQNKSCRRARKQQLPSNNLGSLGGRCESAAN